MTGSQVIDAEEDRHKLVVEYKDALQPADFYHNFKQRGIRSVQLIPYLNLMTGRSDGRFGDSRAVGEIFNCPVRVLGAGRYRVVSRLSFLTPPYKNGVAAKTRNRAVTAGVRLASPVPARSPGDARQRALCGLSGVYSYSAPHMRVMRDLIKQHRSPMELMTMLR